MKNALRNLAGPDSPKAVKHQAVGTSEVEKNPKNHKRHITHSCQHSSKHFKEKKNEIEKFKISTLKQMINLHSSPYQK